MFVRNILSIKNRSFWIETSSAKWTRRWFESSLNRRNQSSLRIRKEWKLIIIPKYPTTFVKISNCQMNELDWEEFTSIMPWFQSRNKRLMFRIRITINKECFYFLPIAKSLNLDGQAVATQVMANVVLYWSFSFNIKGLVSFSFFTFWNNLHFYFYLFIGFHDFFKEKKLWHILQIKINIATIL